MWFSVNQALRHDWFISYYARYASQIERKSIAQKRKLEICSLELIGLANI